MTAKVIGNGDDNAHDCDARSDDAGSDDADGYAAANDADADANVQYDSP